MRPRVNGTRSAQKRKTLIGFAVGAAETEAEAAPRGVAGVEGESADEEPRHGDREDEGEAEVEDRRDGLAEGEQQEERGDDEVAFEDFYGVGEILEGVAEEAGVGVKIAALADLGPRGVEAERDDGEEDVDDPDFEILLPFAGEDRGVRRLRRWRRRWCCSTPVAWTE
jgi:hypothetical protein